jgi:hypothetical protein
MLFMLVTTVQESNRIMANELRQENGFMKETNLSRSGLQSCCIFETKDTGLHVTMMTTQNRHLFLSH